jgi:Domain of unknown function (DUF222)
MIASVLPGPPPSVVEAHAFPDDAAAWARMAAPGAAVIGPLSVVGPRRLSTAGQIDALVAYERQTAWLAAQQYRLLAALADDAVSASATPAEAMDKEWIREDVRAALGLSAVNAGLRLAMARELTTRLSDTLPALERGEVSDRHVRALSDLTSGLSDDDARRVQDVALQAARAAQQSGGAMVPVAEFRRTLRRARAAVEQVTEEHRHEQAVLEGTCESCPCPTG